MALLKKKLEIIQDRTHANVLRRDEKAVIAHLARRISA